MQNPSKSIRKILIAGGGTAGWMTAAALSHSLKGNCEIRLVESDSIGTIGVGEASIPPLKSFNDLLRIDERDFVKQTSGSFKLGIEFVNWARKGDAYFHPFGSHGHAFDTVAVHQYWLKARREGEKASFQDNSMAWHLAKNNKFALPTADKNDPRSTLGYAYHFDAGLYAKYLREYSEAKGVKRIEGKIVDVVQDSETGFVTSVKLEHGASLEADLFIDCTGFRALLIDGAVGSKFEDWGQWLPCDSAVTVGSEKLDPIPSYTRSTAHDAGWQWRIPLQHRTGNGYIYCSKFESKEGAEKTLVENLDTKMTGTPRHIKFKTGIRREPWVKNVVAIGLSSGFMEPLESTSIHLIQANISKLLALFPDKDFDQNVTNEFNKIAQEECEKIKEFLVLHYKLTERDDSPFWRQCRDMEIPNVLANKIEHFRKYGRHIACEKDIFGLDSWLAVHIGQRNIPENLDPLAVIRNLDGAQVLSDLRATMEKVTQMQPLHEDFVNQHCKAEPMG